MTKPNTLLQASALLNFSHPDVKRLIAQRRWHDLSPHDRVGAAYDFTRNEIAFGYNQADDIPASQVLADGYGQCNTKATLLMALLRALDLPCRLHGFTIHKALQRGVVPELAYAIAPARILHSWVEVQISEHWIKLEGFILDERFLTALQRAFPQVNALCAYGTGTDCLADPAVEWRGEDTFIQATGIAEDLGLWDTPDEFYTHHQQDFGPIKTLLYRYALRHWMNARVQNIRRGYVPAIPGLQQPTRSEVCRSEAKSDALGALANHSSTPHSQGETSG